MPPKGLDAITFAAQLAVARLREPIGGLAVTRQSDLISLVIDKSAGSPDHSAPVEHDQSGAPVDREGGDLSIIVGFCDDEVDHIPDMIARSDESDWVDRDNEQNDWESRSDNAPPPILSHRGSNAYDEAPYARYRPRQTGERVFQPSRRKNLSRAERPPRRSTRGERQAQPQAASGASEIEAPSPRSSTGRGFRLQSSIPPLNSARAICSYSHDWPQCGAGGPNLGAPLQNRTATAGRMSRPQSAITSINSKPSFRAASARRASSVTTSSDGGRRSAARKAAAS